MTFAFDGFAEPRPRPAAVPPPPPRVVELDDERRKSQISDGHRLLRLARQKRFQLYSEDEFHSRAIHTPASYWLNTFIPAMKAGMNEAVAMRVTATISRARKSSSAYGVKKLGISEYVTEAFYDKWWFQIRENDLSRTVLRDRVKAVIDKGEPLSLLFPVLSRKPVSPLKNRGPHPDLAEIHSLARFAEAAQVVNALCPTGCRMTVLADGFKYNRACRTPAEQIAGYQDALRFWTKFLEVDDVVQVVDYERWVAGGLPSEALAMREPHYRAHCAELTEHYGHMFDAARPSESLELVTAKDDVGRQLAFTFRSIATSVFYESLFQQRSGTSIDRYFHDDIQRLYTAYASTLSRPLGGSRRLGEYFPSMGYLGPAAASDLFLEMRKEAWEAAIRYVAISLTDRDLMVLRRIDADAVKLTIHAKRGEIGFVTDRSQSNMTAQHCVGGITSAGGKTKLDFKYRLEREAEGATPVLVERLSESDYDRRTYGPLHALQKAAQPILYVPRSADASARALTLHCSLTRRE